MPAYSPPAGDSVNFGVEAYTTPSASHINFNLTYTPQIVLTETLSFVQGEDIVIPYEKIAFKDSIEVISHQSWVKQDAGNTTWAKKAKADDSWVKRGSDSMNWKRRKL